MTTRSVTRGTSTVAVPDVGRSSPRNTLIAVLLPAPFSPRIPVMPSEIPNVTSLSATTFP